MKDFSHEFKTPIHSIKGMAEYLLHNEIPREEEKEYLNVMAKEAGRLAQLSQNTLLLSKLEHMEVFRKKEEFRLDSQIRDCAILLLPSFEEKNILLEAELPEMKFYGSEEFMKEVWVNLLDNARKYSPEGTRVFIEGKVTEKDLWITVRDEGQGWMNRQSCIYSNVIIRGMCLTKPVDLVWDCLSLGALWGLAGEPYRWKVHWERERLSLFY